MFSNHLLSFLVVVGLLYLTILLAMSMNQKTKIAEIEARKPYQDRQQAKPPQQGKVTPEEFIHVTEWMLMCGILDNTEYNKLVAKSLPYLE